MQDSTILKALATAEGFIKDHSESIEAINNVKGYTAKASYEMINGKLKVSTDIVMPLDLEKYETNQINYAE